MSELVAAPVDISKALAIVGFMHETELQWLAEQAQKYQRIAEVGSYYGRSTRALCDNTPGHVHAYDDWWGPRDTPVDWRARHLILDKFQENLKDHIESGKLIMHEGDHENAVPDGEFDMVFIDGSHDYFDFKRDLERWIPAVTKGGMLCGHDYDIGYPGVLRALYEVIGPTHVGQAANTTIWMAYPQ